MLVPIIIYQESNMTVTKEEISADGTVKITATLVNCTVVTARYVLVEDQWLETCKLGVSVAEHTNAHGLFLSPTGDKVILYASTVSDTIMTSHVAVFVLVPVANQGLVVIHKTSLTTAAEITHVKTVVGLSAILMHYNDINNDPVVVVQQLVPGCVTTPVLIPVTDTARLSKELHSPLVSNESKDPVAVTDAETKSKQPEVTVNHSGWWGNKLDVLVGDDLIKGMFKRIGDAAVGIDAKYHASVVLSTPYDVESVTILMDDVAMDEFAFPTFCMLCKLISIADDNGYTLAQRALDYGLISAFECLPNTLSEDQQRYLHTNARTNAKYLLAAIHVVSIWSIIIDLGVVLTYDAIVDYRKALAAISVS